MTRSKLLLAWSTLLLGLVACDKTTDPAGGKSRPANLTVNLSSTELTAGGSAVDVSVAVSSDTGIRSIEATFKTSSGASAAGSFFPQFASKPAVGDKTFASSGWKLSASPSAAAGSYTMTLVVTDKSDAVSTKEVAFVVKSGKTEAAAPIIAGFGLSNSSPTAGTSINTRGSVAFETSTADVYYSVVGPSSTSISLPASFSVSSSPASLYKEIAISPSAPAGTYTVTVTVRDVAGKSASSSASFQIPSTVVTGETLVRLGGVQAGAQSASAGSFIELSGTDAGTVYTIGAGIPYRTIDVVFGADGTTPSFMSPDYAATGAFSLSSWTTLNTTELVDMGTSKPANSGVLALALDDRGTHTVAVVAGHYYGVWTESGEIAMLHVTALNGSGRSATANVDVYLVEGGSTPVDPVTPINWPKITLGAQGAIEPSALDIDGGIAYTAGTKTDAEIASIDLLLYNESFGELRFISPSYAASKSLSMVNGWSRKNLTLIYDNGTSPVTTSSRAESLLASQPLQEYAKVLAGHYYVIEQANGFTSVVKVESVSGSGNSATAEVSMISFDIMGLPVN